MFFNKNEKNTSKAQLTPVPAPVSEALILICEKCGKKLNSDEDNNPARKLQRALKDMIKAHDGKGKLRPVVTTCQDVCPKGELTVAISSTHGGSRFFTVKGTDAEAEAIAILEEAQKK